MNHFKLTISTGITLKAAAVWNFIVVGVTVAINARKALARISWRLILTIITCKTVETVARRVTVELVTVPAIQALIRRANGRRWNLAVSAGKSNGAIAQGLSVRSAVAETLILARHAAAGIARSDVDFTSWSSPTWRASAHETFASQRRTKAFATILTWLRIAGVASVYINLTVLAGVRWWTKTLNIIVIVHTVSTIQTWVVSVTLGLTIFDWDFTVVARPVLVTRAPRFAVELTTNSIVQAWAWVANQRNLAKLSGVGWSAKATRLFIGVRAIITDTHI